MDIEKINKVHCIGIAGIGVSALARFFDARGSVVTGSDINEGGEIISLKKKGIFITTGQKKENISDDVDLVIYSSAVDLDNVELVAARDKKIQTVSYAEALGLIMDSFISIAVSGTNGKTTTTAVLGSLLVATNLDPTVIIGGHVPDWDTNVRLGKSDIFIAEACEYKRNMLHLSPHMIVLTNIEEDHLDYYRNLDDIIDAFTEYVEKLSQDDVLICNADDDVIRNIIENVATRVITFGISPNAQIRAQNIRYENMRQKFEVSVYGEDVGTFETILPGIYNVYNILAALSVCFDMSCSVEALKKGLKEFGGTWRRFEVIGTRGDTTIISDYAHHPTAVKETLRAAKDMFGGAKILAVFQPHQKDRTIKLFDAFVESFSDADTVILSEIYEVAGREDETQKISSKDLMREMRERGGVDEVLYSPDIQTTQALLEKEYVNYDIVLIMGAGDIDTVARNMIKD